MVFGFDFAFDLGERVSRRSAERRGDRGEKVSERSEFFTPRPHRALQGTRRSRAVKLRKEFCLLLITKVGRISPCSGRRNNFDCMVLLNPIE